MLYPYTLGVVAIMKNEAPYVKEWLDYHLNAGVDIVYLYDNDSEDNLEEIVLPYVQEGRVIYQKFPGGVPQLRCYNDAILKYRWTCKYLAFIDADEFIYPTGNGSIADFAENFFEGQNDLAVLHIFIRHFGSNGEEKADFTRGVLQRFNKRDSKVSIYERPLINPRLSCYYIDTPNSPYTFTNTEHLNESRQNIAETKDYCSAEKIFIAHFSSKSKEEWILRHSDNDAFFDKSETKGAESLDMEKFNALDRNEVEDNRVYEYYLKNLSNPIERKNIKQSDCLKTALEVLEKNNLNMEEYLGATHILVNNDNVAKNKKILIESFRVVLDNMTAYYMELFLQETPFMLKYDIMDKKILKDISKVYYKTLQIAYLSTKQHEKSARLCENKKWLDIL